MSTPSQRKKGGDDDKKSENQNDDPAIPGEPHHSEDGLGPIVGEQAIDDKDLG